jgi:hypothetical protein
MNFTGQIFEGKFIPFDGEAYRNYLLTLESEKVEVEVKKFRNSRSLEQNRYYWQIVAKISEHTGYTKDETHALLGSKFLKDHVDIQEGEEMKRYTVVKSSSSLKTDEMAQYIEEAKQWAAQELQLFIPD